MKQTIKGFLTAVILALVSLGAYAQVTTSSISGCVTDQQGGVAGAAVVLTYQPSGVNYYSVTDEKGFFRINSINPGGPYVVRVEMLGYKQVDIKDVYASLGENNVVNVELQETSLSLDALVFTADGADSGMNIERSGVGTTISQRTMASLPTVQRTMNDIMKLTPQASATSAGFAVGGGNYRSSYVTVDGAAFNESFGLGSNLPANGSPISLDALEQMSVNITPFDVRYSGFTGGAINAVTKSGTNEWHASLYDYYNSGYLKGRSVGDQDVAFVKSLNNTTGLSVGGPIIKDKLFFFVNFEYTLDEVPGSEYVAQTTADPNWAPGTSVNRPTVDFMNGVRDYLIKTYGYDPGRYQGYSLSTPDWKLLARVDWNINDNHRFNIRYSHTMNKTSEDASSSFNPLSNIYNRKQAGRTSQYAMGFESNRYFKERNFMSLAAELNSRFGNNVTNVLRVTWSHQNEPRSFVGGDFPTVDILGEPLPSTAAEPKPKDVKTVLTSFGPDPFTYGNLVDVQTVVATDEVTISKGINNITAGLQFEWNGITNGFMQGGAGYYVYDSWDDFVQDKQPVAFAITHSNRDDLKQVYPGFQYMQASAYVQDELNISDNFKLTAGLRFELPIYPTVEGNVNKDFARLAAIEGTSITGMSTADMPSTRLSVSPRVGFNWDILKNRSLILRGGTGVYTGRIPFAWIVTSVLNSNCMQAQYIDSKGVTDIKFHTTTSEILKDLYGGTFKAQDLPASTSGTIISKDLKMPSTWKSSLALDANLPGGVKATLEGIFSKEFNSTYLNVLGMKQTGLVQLPGEPGVRPVWGADPQLLNSSGGQVLAYYINNTDLSGYYGSITAQLRKDFNFGLSMMAAYTYSSSSVASDGWGDQISSAYSYGVYTKNGSNTPELGYSSFVSPHRLIANVNYRIDEGRFGATTLGLFYEGYNHCYVGGASYSRYSYVMPNVTSDYGSANLMYIPTEDELMNEMTFSSEENKAAFNSFINSDDYLSKHRGEYSKRGAGIAPWQNRINFRVAQDFNFRVAQKVNTIQVALDINNVGNLLNRNWGTADMLLSDEILSYDSKNNAYTFTAPVWSKLVTTDSTWSMLLSLRYFF